MRNSVLTALGLTVATLGLAVPAAAQEVDPRDAFTGPRVGAILGYDTIRPGSSEDDDYYDNDQSADGLLYGADVGYDIALGRQFVIGAEGEIAGSTGKVETDRYDPNFFGYGRVKQGRDLYAGVRAGFLARPSTLVYAKGGYTNARLDLTRRDDTNLYGNQHYNLDGWRLGAGVEQAMGNKAYVKLEYRYSNYEDARYEFANGTNTRNFDVDTDRHQVAVGAGIRF